MSFSVMPIPDEISSAARTTLMSPQYKGLSADVRLATGYGPCRSCLKVFRQGEERRVYITYDPFDGLSELPDPGPIFIHESECEPFRYGGFPHDLLDLPLLLEAFGDDSTLISRLPMDRDRVGSQIDEIFADQDVRFVNLRNREAGCFVARIDRA